MAKRPQLSQEALKFFRDQGKLGGEIGGKKRAESLSGKRRAEIAKKASAARWKDKKK